VASPYTNPIITSLRLGFPPRVPIKSKTHKHSFLPKGQVRSGQSALKNTQGRAGQGKAKLGTGDWRQVGRQPTPQCMHVQTIPYHLIPRPSRAKYHHTLPYLSHLPKLAQITSSHLPGPVTEFTPRFITIRYLRYTKKRAVRYLCMSHLLPKLGRVGLRGLSLIRNAT